VHESEPSDASASFGMTAHSGSAARSILETALDVKCFETNDDDHRPAVLNESQVLDAVLGIANALAGIEKVPLQPLCLECSLISGAELPRVP
jgi:hypothetical protein